MAKRVLITGSRSWPEQDLDVIARALLRHMVPGDTLVHGGAAGVDTWAAAMWKPHGPVEEHLAIEHADPLKRNLHMISLGASVCLAFATKWRSGTGHCARHARKAGIPTLDYGVDTSIEARG